MIQFSTIKKYFFLTPFFILFLLNTAFAQLKKQQQSNLPEQYVCLPCGQDCDNDAYNGSGNCKHCHMQLIKKSRITFKTIQPDAICGYIKNHPRVILLDVRTKEEFEGKANPDPGSLKNAINIPIQDLPKKLSVISHLKKKEIIVYCSHSHRSPQVSYLLTQHGFTNVTNMAGGMSVMKDNECKK
jgi:rhodanese-related sulfurtransferase/DNA-directed RNA polymerase subunit RPC12/RpoP